MASMVPKNQTSFSDAEKMNNYSEDQEPKVLPVTTHLYLKPTNSSETLDKDVVLRRIRQRKRVNKFRSALQALLISPFSGGTDNVSVHEKKWLDDAFSAP
ncbi:hypothetical protein HHK36_009996 [Tetracentron sinense]|uniref:Uncharacterized protein n=1 Tax=Tetracentron sinense TaxID=13715 RepID=A0A834ZH30_TETSI|nr:hypothetical protein HHK36_009996 [Tetracentron sinense]